MSHNVWKDTMVTCMGRYCDKITININKAVAEGFKLIVESNAPNMPRLIKKLANEKDKSLLWLQCRCAEMDNLIEEVMTKGGNASLKQQVLDLLKTLRKPVLPDISFIYHAVGRRLPSNNMRSSFLPCQQHGSQ